MTALPEYQRLESTGLWRASPDGQRREVLVVFGDATLVISDTRTAAALAHWSLPAVIRLNPGKRPALFAPGAEAGEELEIEDATMIAAIGKVHRLIEARRPHPGRLRQIVLGAVLALLAAFALFWLPGALIRHTAAILPAPKRDDIGALVLGDLARLTGAPCSTPEGDAALARLSARVLGPGQAAILVLPTGLDSARVLPGGRIVLPRVMAESDAPPEVLAGHILTARLRADREDPTRALLDWAGLGTAFALLTTGEMSADAVHGYAETFLTQPLAPVPADPLIAAFRQAGVPSSPYAYALDQTGEATLDLIETDPFRSGPAAAPVLVDGDWVALQGICSGRP